jgi:predicted neutral ceramidase superfamily lipid hydrolase
MESVIQLIIAVLIFCGVAYAMFWVVTKFGLPQPVLWICGAVLLIALLLFLGQFFGLGGGSFRFGR